MAARRHTAQTDSSTSVMLARRVTGRPRNRANSIAIIFGVAAGWRGDVDDRDVPGGVGCRWVCIVSMVLPSWVRQVVLPVRAGPDRISPHRPTSACRFRYCSRRPSMITCWMVGVATTSSFAWCASRASS